MFLNFQTDRFGQSVQTQIRQLLEEHIIRVFTVCQVSSLLLFLYSGLCDLARNPEDRFSHDVALMRLYMSEVWLSTPILHIREQ